MPTVATLLSRVRAYGAELIPTDTPFVRVYPPTPLPDALLANLERGGDRKSDQTANLQFDSISRAEAAEKLNVSERTVNAAKKVQTAGIPELREKVEQGD